MDLAKRLAHVEPGHRHENLGRENDDVHASGERAIQAIAGVAPACYDERPDVVIELTLILPALQFQALEEQATSGGITTGQLLRRLIQNWL